MRSKARKHTGETLLDHMQALGRDDIETVMVDLTTPDGVLWRSGAVIPPHPRLARSWATSPITGFSPVFPEIAGYRKSHRKESARRSR
jgi:hypothetical protein